MSVKKASIVVSLLFILHAACAYSEEGMGTRLGSLIDEALLNNPKVKAEYDKYSAKRSEAIQVGALPDPKLSYSYFGESVETRVGPQENKYGASQTIPFPGKLILKRQAVKKEAAILKERYEAQKRELEKNVRFTYYDIFWMDRAIDITQQEKSIIDNLEKVAKKKYETAMSPQQDVIKAQVEISKLIDKLFMLKAHRKSLEAKMNSLLSRPKATPFDKVQEIDIEEFDYSLADLHKMAGRTRHELIAANLDIERAEYQRSLANLDFLPDFSFGFDYIDVGDGKTMQADDGKDAWMTTFTVSVPIWLDKQVAGVEEKQAVLRSSKSNYEDIKNTVIYEVEDIYYKIIAYRDIVGLYETALVPQTEQAFEASRTAYEAGKVDFLNWLDAERVLLQTKLAYYKSIVDYEKSIAYLERVVGQDL
ncbi:MAG: TolC family protein [Candidatus Omnitrophota bacterium]